MSNKEASTKEELTAPAQLGHGQDDSNDNNRKAYNKAFSKSFSEAFLRAFTNARMTAPVQLGQGKKDFVDTSSEGQIGVKESSSNGSLAPRVVTMKVYVGRDIWKDVKEEVDRDVNMFIVERLENLIFNVNEHLGNLNNGGYFVQFDKTVHRLEKSDVNIKRTYSDRLDGNATKPFKQSSIWSRTFTFQEAVQEMKGR